MRYVCNTLRPVADLEMRLVPQRPECNRDRSFSVHPRVTATAALLSFAAVGRRTATGSKAAVANGRHLLTFPSGRFALAQNVGIGAFQGKTRSKKSGMSCANCSRNARRSKPDGSAPMSPSSLPIAMVGGSTKAKCQAFGTRCIWTPGTLRATHSAWYPGTRNRSLSAS
jgi:hypothetical protein